jgi:AAA15 family ATPase/GTPase
MTIYRFGFENLFSFEEEAEISFVMDKRASVNEKSFESLVSGERISKALAIIGANGSGKTNLIKPLVYMLWFITDSFFGGRDVDKNYMKPHMFSKDLVTHFKMEFDVEGIRYRYSLAKTSTKVYAESLDKKTSRLWSKVFSRKWDTTSDSYSINRKGFGNAQMPLDEVDENISLISLAAQYKSKVALGICNVLRLRATNISMYGRETYYGTADVYAASAYYNENEEKKSAMTRFLREQDFGLQDITIDTVDSANDDGSISQFLLPAAIHVRGERKARLPLLSESNGTQTAYYLLSKILPILENGGIIIYDELEGDLHPHMIEPILALFFSKRTNPLNAQLIFTTHSIEVLNQLQKNQIVLVEKNDCSSEAWKLSDVEGVRSDDNLYAKYMSGAYGAVPKM